MGLLDIWNDWKKESDYGRDDLTTAGGLSQRGKTETDPKYIRKEPRITTPRGRVVKQEGTSLPSSNFQTRFSGGNKAEKAQALAASSAAKTPDNTVYQDQIMKGGVGIKQGEDPSWWQGLANKFNSKFDTDKAMAHWKDKGGFEGLMANPAFTMGLAFMQAGAEGKTLGQGSLDNVMKAAGISSHYKQIIEDRKQAPIQATAGDIDEVKGLLNSIGISEGNVFEKVWSKVTGQGNQQMKFDLAAEEIAVQFQKEVGDWQAKNKHPDGTPKIIRSDDKIKILKRLIKDKKVKFKESWLSKIGLTKATVEKDYNFRAQGGPIQAGKPYVVGEKGPEIIIPHSSGNVLSNDDSQIYAMLLAANPQLQKVSKARAERILRSRFPEYFE